MKTDPSSRSKERYCKYAEASYLVCSDFEKMSHGSLDVRSESHPQPTYYGDRPQQVEREILYVEAI